MTRRYLIGSAASVAVGIMTVAIKSAVTKYSGLGDFMLFYFVSEIAKISGISVLYVAKALLAALLFGVFYALLWGRESLRFYLALVLTIVLLVVMSLGEAVIA